MTPFEMAARVADPDEEHGVLTGARLCWDRIEATDGDVSYSAQIKTEYFALDSILVDAQVLAQVVEDDSKLRGLADYALEISSGDALFRLVGQPAEDFPTLPRVPEVWQVIDAGAIRHALERVTPCATMDETRAHLCGVRMDGRCLVATDGHRLGFVETDVAWPEGLVSLRCATILLEFLRDKGTVERVFDERHVFFRSGGEVLTIRAFRSRYPSYRAVLPNCFAPRVAVNRADFLAVLERAQLCATQVNLDFEPGKIVVSAFSDEMSFREAIGAKCPIEHMETSFNATYMIEMFEHVSTRTLEIDVRAPLEPMFIQDGSFTGVIMPARR